MERVNKKPTLAKQVKSHSEKETSYQPFKGNDEVMISTGSTLLDLAICGTRVKGGGVPGGIVLEGFGPEGSGKTVILCEMLGDIQRKGGAAMFNDPEARLNEVFANVNGLNTSKLTINEPDTVSQVFKSIQEWKPQMEASIHGVMTDSLAALSTDLELENKEGDKMGMRRAKEFSEGFRKVCRILKQNNYIMGCSNQIREGENGAVVAPGGRAIAFYASVRLRFFSPEKVWMVKEVAGKEIKKVIGVKVKIEVFKNSCDVPYRTANLYIDFKLGVDDVKANLQYLKDMNNAKTYMVGERSLGVSLDGACCKVFNEKLERKLKDEVIELWYIIESKFESNREKRRV